MTNDPCSTLRREPPGRCSIDGAFLPVEAGGVLEVQEHTALLGASLDAAGARQRKREDRIRLLLIGAFCEQPPLEVLRAPERSGACVIDDDLSLGARWRLGDVGPAERPLEALVNGYPLTADGGAPLTVVSEPASVSAGAIGAALWGECRLSKREREAAPALPQKARP